MSIEYHISRNGSWIEAYPKGVLDVKETIAYFTRLTNDATICQGAVEIVYFKHVTDFNISYRDGENIIRNYKRPGSLRRIQKTIFVCETELAYGIGRMLQTYSDMYNPRHPVVVVNSKDEIKDIFNPVPPVNQRISE